MAIFCKVTQNPHFLKKCKGGTKWTSSANIGKDFDGENGSKTTRKAQLCQFLQGYNKPAFCEKVQRGDQGKFFKNRQKRSPCLKGPKALWRKLNYTLIKMHLKWKDWRRFWGKQAAPKVPEWSSYGNLGKLTQNPHFLKKCKGEPKEIFQKPSKK